MNNNSDEKLNDLLKAWQPRPLAASHVRGGVWHRIANEEAHAPAKWLRVMMAWFDRPAIAAGVVALALAVGIAFGTTASAQAQTEAYLQAMVAYRH